MAISAISWCEVSGESDIVGCYFIILALLDIQILRLFKVTFRQVSFLFINIWQDLAVISDAR